MTNDNAQMTVIVGLGVSGSACLRYLHARGYQLAVMDTRQSPPGLDQARRLLPEQALLMGGLDADCLRRAARVVLSPGVSLQTPAVAAAAAAGVPVIGELELFAEAVNAPVIAVTGSNGKSTVTSLVGQMLQAAGLDVAVGGNLGTPALDLLRDAPAPDAYVLELSSFQLETVDALEPVASVVLNVSEDHLDRHHSLDAYAHIKSRIFRGNGLMVLNRDDALVRRMAIRGRRTVWFAKSAPRSVDDYGLLEVDNDCWLFRGDERLVALSEMQLQGRHNLLNGAAAIALATDLGAPIAVCLEVLRQFRGLPHRMELVARHAGVAWINDSKATNVGATAAAVAGIPGSLILIAGGEGKGQDFQPLAAALTNKVRAVVLMGRDATLIEAAVSGRVPTESAASLDAAVRIASQLAAPGDTVLLSPACASFDMFRNFEDRGDQFRRLVLAEGEA